MSREKPTTYLGILERFSAQTVLVVGDLVADEFVLGEISRVSREAAVLILKHRQTQVLPGGGANAAYNLADLGAQVIPVGVIGDDAAGGALLECFRRRGVETRGIVVAREFTTTTKSRILAGTVHGSRQQVVRIDREPAQPASPARRAEVQRRALRLARRADAALVSDYGYGAASPELAGALGAALNGRPVTIDSRFNLLKYAGATAATPNEPELEEAFHARIGADTRKLEQTARSVLRRMRLEALLVTRGRHGMVLFEPRRRPVYIPVWGSDEIADVTGAGDTVIATFTLALAAGASFEQAARLANFAGGIVVMKRGTATVTLEELREAVTSREARGPAMPGKGRAGAGQGKMNTADKVVGRVPAREIADQARCDGRRLVLANGCFDLLHAGHVRYLEGARACGDLLVVGINSDQSVRALKGDGRPLMDQQARARIVAALSAVDWVVIFDEPDVTALLRELRPQVHAKGTDYTSETVPERETMRALGGEVAIVGDAKHHSTRDLISRIVKAQDGTQ